MDISPDSTCAKYYMVEFYNALCSNSGEKSFEELNCFALALLVENKNVVSRSAIC